MSPECTHGSVGYSTFRGGTWPFRASDSPGFQVPLRLRVSSCQPVQQWQIRRDLVSGTVSFGPETGGSVGNVRVEWEYCSRGERVTVAGITVSIGSELLIPSGESVHELDCDDLLDTGDLHCRIHGTRKKSHCQSIVIRIDDRWAFWINETSDCSKNVYKTRRDQGEHRGNGARSDEMGTWNGWEVNMETLVFGGLSLMYKQMVGPGNEEIEGLESEESRVVTAEKSHVDHVHRHFVVIRSGHEHFIVAVGSGRSSGDGCRCDGRHGAVHLRRLL